MSLALKLVLAPGLVALATVAGRRLGHHVGGLVGALPVVAAPIVLIYAVDHGDAYARHAAGWTVYGVGALAAFCGLYAALADRIGSVALTVLGWLVFGALTALVWGAHPPEGLGLPLALAIIAAVASSLGRPGPGTQAREQEAEARDLVLRMLATAALVLALTTAAGSLGERLAGLLAPFPIITAVLAAFTHASDGPEAAREVLRGFTPGLCSFALFFAVLSVLLGPLPLGAAFAVALLAAAAGHAVLLLTWLRPGGERSPRGPVSAVAAFALSGAVALLAVGALGVQLLRNVARDEALRLAKTDTRLAARLVGPALTPELVAERPGAVRRLDALVHRTVLGDPVVRVKVWTALGRIVYSDEPRIVDRVFPLGAEERRALATGGVDAEVSDLSRPENRFERRDHKLLEVYVGVRSTGGKRLLFETYRRYSAIAAGGRRVWGDFAPALVGALVLLGLLQIPFAWRLARRIERGRREREALLRRAVEASDRERTRIARELHDGAVQGLTGVAFSLAAAAEQPQGDPEADRVRLREGAARTRDAVRELRSLLVEIYPPSLRREGLASALEDVLAPLRTRGVETELSVPPGLALPPEAETVLYRGAQEAARNVLKHARASHLAVEVRRSNGSVVLSARDDGRGFAPGAARREGHLGLDLLDDLAREAGGVLEIRSAPGEGTEIHVEVPAP